MECLNNFTHHRSTLTAVPTLADTSNLDGKVAKYVLLVWDSSTTATAASAATAAQTLACKIYKSGP